MRLDGKIAVVTGGSRGIGACIARRYGREGATVAVVARDAWDKALEVVNEIVRAGGQAVPLRTDVSSVEDCNRLVGEVAKRLGTVDILVNNAGIYRPLTIESTTEEDWDAQINTNLKGTFFMTRAVVPIMKEKRRGKIINISSTAGFVGSKGGSAYCASKGGQATLTKALCIELAPFGINVNVIAPGAAKTQMNEDIRAQLGTEERMNQLSPTGCYWMGADDLSGAAVYLASEESNSVHGAHLLIDNGWTAW